MTVRLIVDGLFLRPAQVGGIEYMLYSLLTALHEARGPDDHVGVLLPEGVTLGDQACAAHVEQRSVAGGGNRFAAVERHLPRDADVMLFPNYYTPIATLARRDQASVTVVHDLQFRSFPENFTPAKRAFQDLSLRATGRLADAVVAISDFTASEIDRWYPPRRGGLHAITNPVDWSRFADEAPPATPEAFAQGPFFLLAAAAYRHKNVSTAIEAFRRLHAKAPEARLVLVGQTPELMRETRVSDAQPDVPGVIALGHVPDAVLAWLYRRARAVLLPSLYEGCGLPCAEALGLGTPVVHSGRAALPEVAAGAGTSVGDPLDPDRWVEAMLDVLNGLVTAPSTETVARVRALHDPVTIGSRYWMVAREVAQRRTNGSRARTWW